ncbi:MAG: glycosyltransferase [Rhodobacterales bacterium]|nr:glycosyltransferase [Rhodobacterales bacterium]
MTKPELTTSHRKALAFCTDQGGVAYGLFAAAQAARMSPDRDFDILVCSLDPLEIPQYFLDLGIRPVVLDLRAQMATQNFTTKRLPLEAYLWMWFAQCLGDVYQRILFLDLDTYILSSEISQFMEVDLGRHAVGCVRDITQWDNHRALVEEFKARNMRGLKFLNSGMVLIDTKAFNAQGILDRIIEINATGGAMVQHDQSLINLALRGDWAEVNPVWNWQWTRSYPFFQDHVGAQILHFQSRQKPWEGGVGQLRFSRIFVCQYYAFLNRHFPDQAFETLPAAAFGRSYGRRVVDLFDHLRKLPRLYFLMRRFKNDMDVRH